MAQTHEIAGCVGIGVLGVAAVLAQKPALALAISLLAVAVSVAVRLVWRGATSMIGF